MPAKLTRGHTYSSGGEVNAANLMDLLAQATMAGCDRANLKRSEGNVFTEVTNWETLGVDLEPAITTISYWPITRISATEPASIVPHARQMLLDATSDALAEGELVLPVSVDGDGLMTVTKALAGAGNGYRVIGASAGTCQPGNRGIVVMHGIIRIPCEQSVSAGDAVASSGTTDGSVQKVKKDVGVFKIGMCIGKHAQNSAWVALWK